MMINFMNGQEQNKFYMKKANQFLTQKIQTVVEHEELKNITKRTLPTV